MGLTARSRLLLSLPAYLGQYAFELRRLQKLIGAENSKILELGHFLFFYFTNLKNLDGVGGKDDSGVYRQSTNNKIAHM